MATTAKPQTVADLLKSPYLSAADLEGHDVTVEIADVDGAELASYDGSGTVYKGIVTFRGKDKKMVLNRTNTEIINAMFGPVLSDWVRKCLTIGPVPDETGKSSDGLALRVKGSPDLSKDMTFTLKLARKKPKQIKLVKTALSAVARQTPAGVDTTTGEIEPAGEADLDARYGETMPGFDDL